MPYKTNQELPDSVKDSLPKAAQDIFRKTGTGYFPQNLQRRIKAIR